MFSLKIIYFCVTVSFKILVVPRLPHQERCTSLYPGVEPVEALEVRFWIYERNKRVIMFEMLLAGGFGAGIIYVICHITSVIGKCYLVHKTTKSNFSDEQTKALAKMMSKDININIPK